MTMGKGRGKWIMQPRAAKSKEVPGNVVNNTHLEEIVNLPGKNV